MSFVVVFDELERVSGVFVVVGSEPSFDLSERRRLADSAEEMLNPTLLAVCVEA
jgi:hypothetical protein